MSRSGYSDYGPDSPEEQWAQICYRGAVTSAMRGKRGQQTLRDIVAALDAMPVKELVDKSLVQGMAGADNYSYCTLGALGAARGLYMRELDPEDWEQVAAVFGIAPAMVREIVYENDDDFYWRKETPAQRWIRMRAWVASQITGESA